MLVAKLGMNARKHASTERQLTGSIMTILPRIWLGSLHLLFFFSPFFLNSIDVGRLVKGTSTFDRLPFLIFYALLLQTIISN